MRRLLLVMVLLIPLIGMAQNNKPIDKLFRKYSHKEGVSSVNLGYFTLKFGRFVCSLAGHSDEADIIKGVNSIHILTVEDKNLNKTINFYKELEADGFFKSNQFEVLMEVTEKNQVVRFCGKSGLNGTISDLLLVVGGDSNALISIRGVLDPKDIGKFTGTMNLGINSNQLNILQQ